MLNFRGAQHLMRDAELAGSCDGVLHKGRGAVMAAGRAGRGQNQAAVADQQAAAGGGFQFFPDLMGAQDQRNEIAAFADGLTSDARVPVRRALVMRRNEAIDADDARAQPGALVEGRAAHSSQADHQNICDRGHGEMIEQRPQFALGNWQLAFGKTSVAGPQSLFPPFRKGGERMGHPPIFVGRRTAGPSAPLGMTRSELGAN